MGLIVFGLIILFVAIAAGKSGGQMQRYRGILMSVGVLVMIIGVATSAIRTINSGHVGVKIFFGQVQDNVLYEGINFVNPLVEIEEMSIRTQNYTMSFVSDEGDKTGDDAIKVLSKDGLEVSVEITILYKIKDVMAPSIFRKIGLGYKTNIVRPITRKRISENAVEYAAVDLYSSKRKAFEMAISKDIANDFNERGLVLEKIMIRDINLPQKVRESIERKITAVQEAERMQYVLDKERQEAERQRVKAKGIADAQKIMDAGLSARVLQYEQIKAMKELVTSENSKVILMGNGGSAPSFIIGK